MIGQRDAVAEPYAVVNKEVDETDYENDPGVMKKGTFFSHDRLPSGKYTKVDLSYTYYQSDYPGKVAIYPNSVSQSASAGISRKASERLTLNSQLSATHFVPQSQTC